jgi:UDP-N-acetylmuramate dehydrogenase
MKSLHNFSLKDHNSFGLDVEAREIHFPETHQEVQELVRDVQDPFVLGGGSNVLFTTNQLTKPVIRPEIKGLSKAFENNDYTIVSAGAGESWQALVDFTLQNDWGGIENLSLIPGHVGAAPIQNIGAYGVELKDVFFALEAIRVEDGALHTFHADMCKFDYRYSVFKGPLKGKYIIAKVFLKLPKNHKVKTAYGGIRMALASKGIDHPSIQQMAQTVNELRRSKLPYPDQIGNAGSFFKNPLVSQSTLNSLQTQYSYVPHYIMPDERVKIPAGWLLEQCHFKGKRQGQAGFYEKHALILVNHGGASGAELWHLAQQAQVEVKEKFGIELEPEVGVIEA